MELDCNLKKLANFFQILAKLLKSDSSLFFPREIISYFSPSALKLISHLIKERVLCQIFELFWPTYSKVSVTMPL